ncbi:cytochrome c nitrite reductase small subunit [Carboxylicivirga sp. M1479]|uniref:cytochrome c nitrite reductase small subunit n=1 Tax=Carboxylicivirga sp. M1479 TaxID=2594476 RepID=UPI001178531C|nr:cytochrome c nitrite reductase small subunit [Carboxylicivirga sp. M1479]TRX70468.1 cytochrome c nitrite reductase small subunit [Carboxylicivirga sp. M1479]
MSKKLIDFLKPPEHWKVPVLLAAGVFVGLGFYVFYVSRAHSYLSDDPKTCVNCHIMGPQYATWNHSAHREAATCNDCHVPHDNVFNTYYFKAKDGMRHATMFTLRAEPQVIFIKEEGQHVVQQNCVRCHTQLITNDKVLAQVPDVHQNIDDRFCWECHRETPHGRVNSLSSVPDARIPVPESPLPDWIKDLNSK